MRPGGGKPKGNEFERWVGRQLSIWITDGARTNIFARNVLSGGGFTVTLEKGLRRRTYPVILWPPTRLHSSSYRCSR